MGYVGVLPWRELKSRTKSREVQSVRGLLKSSDLQRDQRVINIRIPSGLRLLVHSSLDSSGTRKGVSESRRFSGETVSFTH